MNLHAAEAGFFRQGRAGRETLDHLFDLGLAHGFGFGKHFRKGPQVQRYRRGCQRLLAQAGHGLAARVIELHPEVRTTGTTDARPFTKTLKVTLIFEHHTGGTGHGATVDHHVAGQQQTGFALGPSLVQAKQGQVRRLFAVGEVFFHRGFGDAIAEGLAVGQIQELKGRHA
ncbi:hypothetical protein D3C73_1077780 [compost metagenome]